MKAITLHQPWASLIALGVKSIETRSWRTAYRGRLAIHAGRHVPVVRRPEVEVLHVGDFEVERDNPRGTSAAYMLRGSSLSWPYRLPLGAVVATALLVDVVPITRRNAGEPDPGGGGFVVPYNDGALGLVRAGSDSTQPADFSIADQRPYGDFAPGRWAWLLADVQPIAPVPAVGHQQLWEWTPANEMEMA